MKSACEVCYDRYVVSNLCRAAISDEERVSLTLDFFSSREERYDLLCEHVYLQANGEAPSQSLWLTPIGESYLAMESRAKGDICLISEADYLPFSGDTKEQMQMVCDRISEANLPSVLHTM